MKLWVLSDWHMEMRISFDPQPRPDFDVLVVAGDVENVITTSIMMVAALAAGKPAVFVAGNDEWWDPGSMQEKLEAARRASRKYGVHFLECETAEIGGVRFAGATQAPR
jgi:predicted phosphodiesterase